MPSPDILLALVGLCLVLALSGILLKRKLYKRFPVFLWYCLLRLAVAVLRLLLVRNPVAYFVVYWVTEAVYFVVALLAMLSLLHPVTQIVYRRHPWSRFILLPIGLLTIGLSLWVALFKPIDWNGISRFASGIYVFVLLMCLLELWLFVVALRVRGRLPIKWTEYEFGILAGFGTLALLMLIAYLPLLLRLLHLDVPPQIENFYRYSPAGAFLGSATVWLISFWRPEPPRPEPPDLSKLHDAARILEEQIGWVKQALRRHGLDFVALPASRKSSSGID